MQPGKFVDISMYRDLDVRSFRVRCLNAEDLIIAAGRCVPMNEDGQPIDINPAIFGVQLRQQQMAQSIVEVDGEAVVGPCLASLKWNSRTREFVAMAYDYVNSLTMDEKDGFMAALAKPGSAGAVTSTPPAASAAE